MKLIDTHAHLDDARFHADLPAVLARAATTGVEHILSIGIDLATSFAAVEIAKAHAMVKAVPGIQPNHASEAAPTDWDSVVSLVNDQREHVVAIGETGLDKYWDRCPFPVQQDYFARHLELCRRTNLPVIIHCREAEADVVAMLKAAYETHGPISGVMHSFTGDLGTAEACLKMGLHISFAGMITYKTAGNIRDVAKAIPSERILVETDCPYLAPVPHRGQRNEPAFVAHTLAVVAGVRGVTPDMLAEQTTANAKSLFKL